jgi:hypothetical protein
MESLFLNAEQAFFWTVYCLLPGHYITLHEDKVW